MDTKGRNPSVWGFRRDKAKDIHKKNPPDSFPRTTRKGHGKDAKGRNLSVGGFRRDKVKDIPIRIRLNPFLGQPEGVMERMQMEETPRLGVFEGIRTFKKEFARILSSDNPKGLWKGYQDKKPLGWGSPDAMNMDHLNLVSTRKKKKKKKKR
jgi:hypothetical protein